MLFDVVWQIAVGASVQPAAQIVSKRDHPFLLLLQPQIRKSWDSMENANKKRK